MKDPENFSNIPKRELYKLAYRGMIKANKAAAGKLSKKALEELKYSRSQLVQALSDKLFQLEKKQDELEYIEEQLQELGRNPILNESKIQTLKSRLLLIKDDILVIKEDLNKLGKSLDEKMEEYEKAENYHVEFKKKKFQDRRDEGIKFN